MTSPDQVSEGDIIDERVFPHCDKYILIRRVLENCESKHTDMQQTFTRDVSRLKLLNRRVGFYPLSIDNSSTKTKGLND